MTAPAGETFTTVIPDGTGFLAVGADGSSEATDYAPTFWRSDDGLAWHRIHLTSDAPFVPDRPERYFYTVTGLARAGGVMVAVGDRLLLDASTGDAAMWYSLDDGTTWHRSASGASFPDAYVYAVAHGPTGFVAVGSNGYPGASTQDTGTRGAAVWTSRDGIHWLRTPTHTAFRGGYMLQVIAVRGGYIASGRAHFAAGVPGSTPPIWSSTDGRTWHHTPTSASLKFADGLSVAIGPDGYLATGTVFDPEAGTWNGAIWSSPTGTSWTRSKVDGGFLVRILSVDGHLIAVGSAASAPGTSTYQIGAWTSSRGRSWQAIPAVEGFSGGIVRDAAANGNRVVIVGEDTDPDLTTPIGFIWVGIRT